MAQPKTIYDGYGELSARATCATALAGRYPTQAAAETLIAGDVAAKLALGPTHTLLEIGCGVGNLLIPLSFRVATATGVDHPAIVARARTRFADPSLAWIEGQFPDVVLAGPFDRILIYSVVHYLDSLAAVEDFLDRALDLLAPGGRLLIGDLPNSDRKRRFQASPAGQAFETEWRAMSIGAADAAERRAQAEAFGGTTSLGAFSDADILALLGRYRRCGCHTYVLAQDPALPFGHTREDLVIVKP